MRSKKEIKECHYNGDDDAALSLEVLLDIRELIAGKEVKEVEPFGGPY